MKKVLATILAFLYLSTTMGATVHLHYCMGKLASWGLFDHGSKDCSFCGMPKKAIGKHCITAKKACCKDEHKQINTDKYQKVAQSGYELLKVYPHALALYNTTQADYFISSFEIEFPTANAPPLTGKVPAFVLNCNFRI